jgi:glycosyltransferase involved in cell wall biosynthesis
MATKAIPIVSSLDNYRSFFQDGVNGFYLKNINDPEELAIIITKAIENYTEISPKIYQCNNQYIMKYHDWKINSKKQVDLYD